MTDAAVAALPGRVREALRRRWPDARIHDWEPLTGGISSLTFSAVVCGAPSANGRVVIKVAPPGLPAVRNRDVLRQARVMAAVHGACGVRVPAVLARADGEPPFFVMEFVEGEAYEPKWDVCPAPPAPAMVAARARRAARMLARLQALDPGTVGLGDEPVLGPGDELGRWARLYATAGDDLRAGERTVAEALAARVPELRPRPAARVPASGSGRLPGTPRGASGPVARAAILHGDYRLGNMQFAGERPAAIIDWEIWSLGDPRHDLAWLMAFTDPVAQRVGARDPLNQAAADAMPSARALLREYLHESGDEQPPPDLEWFLALAYYKLGATMSVLAKRNRRLPQPDPGLELAAQTTPAMLERALALVG